MNRPLREVQVHILRGAPPPLDWGWFSEEDLLTGGREPEPAPAPDDATKGEAAKISLVS